MRWAQQQRMTFIASRLESVGFINRRELQEFFGISLPTASADLQAFLKLHPGKMRYNFSNKRYEKISQ